MKKQIDRKYLYQTMSEDAVCLAWRKKMDQRRKRGACLFKSEKEMREAFKDYLDLNAANPFTNKKGEVVDLPLTITSMCMYFGIGSSTWGEWLNGQVGEDQAWITEVSNELQAIMNDQKIQGVLMGDYQHVMAMSLMRMGTRHETEASVDIYTDKDRAEKVKARVANVRKYYAEEDAGEPVDKADD